MKLDPRTEGAIAVFAEECPKWAERLGTSWAFKAKVKEELTELFRQLREAETND